MAVILVTILVMALLFIVSRSILRQRSQPQATPPLASTSRSKLWLSLQTPVRLPQTRQLLHLALAIGCFYLGGWTALIYEPPYKLFEIKTRAAYGSQAYGDVFATAFQANILEPHMKEQEDTDPKSYEAANERIAKSLGEIVITERCIAISFDNRYFGVANTDRFFVSNVLALFLLILSGSIFFDFIRRRPK